MLNNADLKLDDIIKSIQNKRKYVHYDFQELGLMIAKKLNDEEHKSLYIKLAKFENQELLLNALSYTLNSPNAGTLNKLFMWKLKQLRDSTQYRMFIGLFLQNTQNVRRIQNKKRQIAKLQDIHSSVHDKDLVNKCYQGISKCGMSLYEVCKQLDLLHNQYVINKIIPCEKWHVTLFFKQDFPANLYMPLSIMLEKFYTQKAEFLANNPIVVNRLRFWMPRNSSTVYLVLDQFDKNVYKLYYSLVKFMKTYSGRYKKQILEMFSDGLSKRIYPHITLARFSWKYFNQYVKDGIKDDGIKNQDKLNIAMNEENIDDKGQNALSVNIAENLHLNLKMCITVAISKFIKKHNKQFNYYSLNYGIGGCWHRKNL